MRIFHCDGCRQLIFFENSQCVSCERALAFLPDVMLVAALEPAGEDFWQATAGAGGGPYRLCQNYRGENVCNWAVPANDPSPLCTSCRLTRVIPDLNVPGRREAWYALEVAKRRAVFSLLTLELPLESKSEDPEHGLAFEFLADGATHDDEAAPVVTGHSDGVIVINVAEADDAEREKRRLALREPYRTLLGHIRHEIGHFYWDRLVRDGPHLERYRAVFGDEREDYAAALQRYYDNGAPADWQSRFVSAYASSHAWEDWAETWAHFLHMTDTLETAFECGLALLPARSEMPSVRPIRSTHEKALSSLRRNDCPLACRDLPAQQSQ